MGIRGLTYCTHALGPIMQWFQGDRVVRVCCEDAGSHYTDGEGEHFAGDTAVMLAKTERGRLIKIRVDLTSNRPCKRASVLHTLLMENLFAALCLLWTIKNEPRKSPRPHGVVSHAACAMPAHESLFGSDGLNFELQGTGGVVEVRNSHGEGNWGQGRLSLATSADGGNSRDNTEPGAQLTAHGRCVLDWAAFSHRTGLGRRVAGPADGAGNRGVRRGYAGGVPSRVGGARAGDAVRARRLRLLLHGHLPRSAARGRRRGRGAGGGHP